MQHSAQRSSSGRCTRRDTTPMETIQMMFPIPQQVYAVVEDLTSIGGNTRAIGEAAGRLGGIDVLVLNDR